MFAIIVDTVFFYIYENETIVMMHILIKVKLRVFFFHENGNVSSIFCLQYGNSIYFFQMILTK